MKVLVYHYMEVIKLLKIMTKTLQNLYFQFHTFGNDMLEKEKHKLRQKNFLITVTLFSKEFRSYKSLRKTFFEELLSITLTLHFLRILLKFQAGMSPSDTCLSCSHVTTGWGDLSPHLRSPGLPDAIGVKYFSYWNHSDLQRMYTEVPLLQTQYN